MTSNMKCFDDLPERASNHVTEEKAETAFQKCLTESGLFILQRADRKDYGTDCEIEVVEDGEPPTLGFTFSLRALSVH
ncbi:hypothetical protein K06K5_52500 (plasmid) [Vibrio alginolyticus]|nr:hypothetical protein K06K5_52500 [Vibrio alginolyticus]